MESERAQVSYWRADYSVDECQLCGCDFGFFTRRHHCRNCGGIFCDPCSSKRMKIAQLGYDELVRVCNTCAKEVYVPLSQKDADIKAWLMMITNNRKLHKRIFQGVPNRLRPSLWPRFSDSIDLVEKNPNLYESLTRNIHRSKFREQIANDIERTFPEHPLFQVKDGQGQKSLSNVLESFTVFREEVGYHQGMNFLVAVLLIHMNEENAFWCFVQLMKKYNLDGFFINSTPLLDAVLKKFDYWMGELLPTLYNHFKEEGIAISIVVSQWFKTLFSYSFPLDIVFRVWDVFLIEGTDFLIWVGLVILDSCQEQLLPLKAMEILNFLKKLPGSTFSALSAHLNAQTK